MDVRILQETIAENEKRVVRVFNPTSLSYTITHRDKTFTIDPVSELEVPYYTAELFVTRIVDYLANASKVVVTPKMLQDFAKRIRLYEQD